MSEITRTEIWSGALFPYTQWDDSDKNGRVSVPELRPLPAIKNPHFIAEINAEIEGYYRSMIDHLDKNGDGVSFEEIKQGFFPQEYNYEIDYNEAAQKLLSEGVYKASKCPVMFVTDKTLPQGVKDLEYYQEIASADIEAGACKTMRVAFVDGEFLHAQFLTKEAFCVVYIAPKYIREAKEKGPQQLMNIMRHEMVHVRQDLTGRSDESEGLSTLIARRADFQSEQALRDFAGLGVGNDILELEAYKTTIRDCIAQRNTAEIKETSAKINIYFSSLNYMMSILKKAGVADMAGLIGQMRSEVLSDAEIEEINSQIRSLVEDVKEGKEDHFINKDFSREDLLKKYGAK